MQNVNCSKFSTLFLSILSHFSFLVTFEFLLRVCDCMYMCTCIICVCVLFCMCVCVCMYENSINGVVVIFLLMAFIFWIHRLLRAFVRSYRLVGGAYDCSLILH